MSPVLAYTKNSRVFNSTVEVALDLPFRLKPRISYPHRHFDLPTRFRGQKFEICAFTILSNFLRTWNLEIAFYIQLTIKSALYNTYFLTTRGPRSTEIFKSKPLVDERPEDNLVEGVFP